MAEFNSGMNKMQPVVELVWEENADRKIPLPGYQTHGAAGADVRANFATADRTDGALLQPMERRLVPTGLRASIPEGYEVQVRPRSGLALKHGVTLVNTPGTIDSDYRGPIGVLLVNLGSEPFRVRHGDRIAQFVVAPVSRAEFLLVDGLEATQRGAGGFGSTGSG